MRVGLALHARHRVHRVLHLFDQAALDRLGELDARGSAATPRCGRAASCTRARRYFFLSFFGISSSFSASLVKTARALAHLLDLREHFLGALLDHLVGDFLVAEDDQLADGALAGAQLVAGDEDALGDGRRARDRLDHRQLAALDALGDGHLALAGEQRHRAHLAQVHADGVVGLVEGAGREVELGPVFVAVAIEVLVAAVGLVRIDDLDAGAAEGVEEIVEILR